jgi:hypothetical protein
MKVKFISTLLVLALAWTHVHSQTSPDDPNYRKYFVGSTFFVLGNLSPGNRPDFAQLNFGYRITPRDVISVEAKTWKYAWPLGIPYGKSFQAPQEEYPGFVRDFGVALAYQRFWWRGLYTGIHAMNALQNYVNADGKKFQSGYQLFMTYRLGYHVPLFKNRFFIEPSVAVTHWPVRTNVPESFARLDGKWPKYFLFEPGLHFGFKF